MPNADNEIRKEVQLNAQSTTTKLTIASRVITDDSNEIKLSGTKEDVKIAEDEEIKHLDNLTIIEKEE